MSTIAFVIVAKQDFAQLAEIQLPVHVLSYDEQDHEPALFLNDRIVSDHELSPACIGGVSIRTKGLKVLESLLQRLDDVCGTGKLPICDLTARGRSEYEGVLLRFAADALAAAVQRQARRISGLNKSITALRKSHETTQSAFSMLERFVFDNNLASRTVSTALLPGRNAAPITLQSGEGLVQRLPVASTGLCDVTLYIDNLDIAEKGQLSVALSTVEDGKLHANWTVSGDTLNPGPVRLSLRTSLDAVPMTPVIEVLWIGESACSLACSMRHPDPRFQVQLAGDSDPRVLAFTCWSYLPGCEAMLPASGIPPTSGISPPSTATQPLRRKLVDNALLASAINLTPESKDSRFFPEDNRLLVHPLCTGISAMKIPSALPIGTVHIDARICTTAEKAADIEYALCIHPSSTPSGTDLAIGVSDNAPTAMSSWVVLEAQHVGEVHLPLAAPLDEPHDLHLLTRLVDQPGDGAWCWATFDRIRITLDQG